MNMISINLTEVEEALVPPDVESFVADARERSDAADSGVSAARIVELAEEARRAEGYGDPSDPVESARADLAEAAGTVDDDVFASELESALVSLKTETDGALPLSTMVYVIASNRFEAGRIAEAASLFDLYIHLSDGAYEGYLGLALCATSLDRFDLGLVLARKSAEAGSVHPRVHFVAGLCALKLGEGKIVKHHLALTTRIARRDRRYRADQRAAQRILLLLQFAEG